MSQIVFPVDPAYRPINIIAGPGAPTISELERLGVARVSFGTGFAGAAAGLVKRIAKELRETGTYESLVNGASTHADLNKLVAPKESVPR